MGPARTSSLTLSDLIGNVSDSGFAAVGLLYTAPTPGSTPAERFVALSIAAARKTLYITNAYFAPDAAFVELLAAARRGVDVRILTSGPRTDVNIVRLAGRARTPRCSRLVSASTSGSRRRSMPKRSSSMANSRPSDR